MMLIANWKSCMQHNAIKQWLQHYCDVPGVQQGILLPAPYLYWASRERAARQHQWWLGAQDVDAVTQVVTGATTADMLVDCGVDIVAVGHLETRRYKNLQQQDLAARLQALADRGLQPLLCVGEDDATWVELLPERMPQRLCIAYEPSWAIGATKVACASDIEERLEVLDALLKKRYNSQMCDARVTWLYGGSVCAATVGALASVQKIQGFLVGRSSLLIENWRALIECI